MGPLGVPEMMLIFVLALVLFGPKKLPEIGRTIGKAITEFRKASSELKETFTNEMQNLERETNSIKDVVANQYQNDTYNYDYSSYGSQNSSYEYQEGTNGSESDLAATEPTSESASAPQGAESQSAETPEGAVARGSENEAHPAASEPTEGSSEHHTASAPAEHKA